MGKAAASASKELWDCLYHTAPVLMACPLFTPCVFIVNPSPTLPCGNSGPENQPFQSVPCDVVRPDPHRSKMGQQLQIS